MKTIKDIMIEMAKEVNEPILEAAGNSSKATIKQLDRLGDKVESLQNEFTKSISGGLVKMGLDDSSKTSSSKAMAHTKAITSAFESVTVALSDLANDLDDYHK